MTTSIPVSLAPGSLNQTRRHRHHPTELSHMLSQEMVLLLRRSCPGSYGPEKKHHLWLKLYGGKATYGGINLTFGLID